MFKNIWKFFKRILWSLVEFYKGFKQRYTKIPFFLKTMASSK